jgi:hypothetical protein
MGRPKANLELTEVQRQELERMVRAGRSEKRMVFRARLILECASGEDNVQVAKRLVRPNRPSRCGEGVSSKEVWEVSQTWLAAGVRNASR